MECLVKSLKKCLILRSPYKKQLPLASILDYRILEN